MDDHDKTIRDLLAKMAPIPQWATHVGIANVDTMGVTVVAGSPFRDPEVLNPQTREWTPLLTAGPIH